VLRSNRDVNVFHRGFQACDRYANGLQAVAPSPARCCSSSATPTR
jgi:hypothetical protein